MTWEEELGYMPAFRHAVLYAWRVGLTFCFWLKSCVVLLRESVRSPRPFA